MRYAILAHDRWQPGAAKTGFALVRYSRLGWSKDEAVAVVDRAHVGRDASEVVGPVARGIPTVASVEDAVRLGADAVAIGIAPVGGQLPEDWRPDLRFALERGMTVVSGLHLFLKDDAELAAIAKRTGARIWDVRAGSREAQRIATGEGGLVDALVVTVVGTDCSSGKMTTAVELVLEARKRGIKAAFVATGQTGIMIGCEAGVPLDAVVSDFAAGLMEEALLKAAGTGADLIVVEGQASLSHPAYSGVTLALLHGSYPDLLVLCDEPARRSLGAFQNTPMRFAVNRLGYEMHLNEALLEPITGGQVAAISLMTRGLDDVAFREVVRKAEIETGLPAGDVFRGGSGRILDAVLARATKVGLWKDSRFVKGAKSGPRAEATRLRDQIESPHAVVEGRPKEA